MFKIYLKLKLSGTFGRTAKSLSVRVGSTTNFEGGNIHNVSTIKNHPYFNLLTYDFDVALLQLETKIKINDITTQQITLPYYGEYLPERTPVKLSV